MNEYMAGAAADNRVSLDTEGGAYLEGTAVNADEMGLGENVLTTELTTGQLNVLPKDVLAVYCTDGSLDPSPDKILEVSMSDVTKVVKIYIASVISFANSHFL